jgi:transcriptional regulator with XRE-family HTH domain
MSQAQVAKAAHVSQKTVSAIELYGRGDFRIEYTMESAEGVARALGYEVWQLLLPVPDTLALDRAEPDGAGFRRMIVALECLILNYVKATTDGQRYAALLFPPSCSTLAAASSSPRWL